MISVLNPIPKTKQNRKVNSIKIVCFKCRECGETDRDLAEKYCGNSGCIYRR